MKNFGVLIIVAVVSFTVFNFLFGCLAILSSAPHHCDSLSSIIPLIKIPYIALELPYFLLNTFVDINIAGQYAGIALIIGLILELVYLYFLACVFVNRKIIAEKVPKLVIFTLVLIFLYFSWIVIFDIPKTINRSYSYYKIEMGGQFDDPRYALLKEKGIDPEIKDKGHYSFVWPWAIYKGNRSYPLNRSVADSSAAAAVPVIYLILTALAAHLLFFRKDTLVSDSEYKNADER